MDIRLANEVFNGTDTVTKIYKGDDLVYQFNSELRLIEGTDYEVYDWLSGSGYAYIDLSIYPNFDDELYAKVKVISRPTIINIYIMASCDNVNLVGIATGGNWRKQNIPQFIILSRQVGSNAYHVYDINGSYAREVFTLTAKIRENLYPTSSCSIESNSFSVKRYGNNKIYECPNATYKLGRSIKDSGLDKLKVNELRINGTVFKPCKLLHSIPPKLDSQSKYRESGECGMIDTVSGIFYGNANTVGEFTVENDEV